jgi:hypothetical protein
VKLRRKEGCVYEGLITRRGKRIEFGYIIDDDIINVGK